ncbi:MAG: molybdopterin-dependent oxidoreductase, partial [Gammaproteobacteria bacterium]|nr:molybdopterin-dependent oxidoreductase [Gammaproteobacteria bacterium]
MSGIINLSLTRRKFIQTGITAGSLVLGFTLPGYSKQEEQNTGRGKILASGIVELNAFISLDKEGLVTIQSPFVEMGQGTYTAIPMLVAEEMDISMDSVRVVQAPHGPDYKIMYGSTRHTGGSRSIRSAYGPLRKAGATARIMLLEAAAR